MEIQKIKIISNNICYGPAPSPTDEMIQHLTISSTGRVWFTGYNFGKGFDDHAIGRRQQLTIGKEKALNILLLIKRYFDYGLLTPRVTDIGSWEVIVTDTDKNNKKFKGSLCGVLTFEDINLTEYIQEHIPIDGLFVFGELIGDENED